MATTQNKILITGAAGQYGGLVIKGLLEKGLPPSSLLLLTRTPPKLAEYASRGCEIRQGSFDDPVPELAKAFAGANAMLLISTSRAGKRLPQHQAAIDAAVQAGVTHIAYTSFLSAHLDDPTSLVGKEHRATEDMLRASGLYWTALRDAQYAEAVTDVAGPTAVKSGVVRINAGEGKMPFISRDDCAAAAVDVLIDPTRHRNKAYHITGSELLTWADAARIMGDTVGKSIFFEPLTDDEQQALFDAMGIPREPVDGLVVGGYPWNSTDMVSFGKATRLGEMAISSDDFRAITGRKPQTLQEVCKARMEAC